MTVERTGFGLCPASGSSSPLCSLKWSSKTSWFTMVVTSVLFLSLVPRADSSGSYDFFNCAETCDESLCPELAYCEGVPQKDSCNCCTVCSNNRYQPHALRMPPTGGEACKQHKCDKFQICSENMQGLPLCKCPGVYLCRKKRKREICATNGQTYPSRCHMRVASCHLEDRVKKKYRGRCSSEKDRKIRRRRKNKARRRTLKKKKNEDRKAGKEKRMKKNNRKRRKIGGKNKRERSKRRTRRHRQKHHQADNKRLFEDTFGHYTWSK